MSDNTETNDLSPGARALLGLIEVLDRGRTTDYGRVMEVELSHEEMHDLRALAAACLSFTSADMALLDRCWACVGWKHEEEVDALMRRVAALLPRE